MADNALYSVLFQHHGLFLIYNTHTYLSVYIPIMFLQSYFTFSLRERFQPFTRNVHF